MIPPGPERDKVIAELRDGPKARDMCTAYWKVECPLKSRCSTRCTRLKVKPYSTDIECAMELWEEMFTPQFHNLCTWDLYINGFCPSKSNPKHYFAANIKNKSTGFKHRTGNVRHDTADKAIADVISGAWLKWREGE